LNTHVEVGKLYLIDGTTPMARSCLLRDRAYVMNDFPKEKYGHTQRYPAEASKNFVRDYAGDVVLVMEVTNPTAKFYTTIKAAKVLEYSGNRNIQFIDMVDSILIPYEGNVTPMEDEELKEIMFWSNITEKGTSKSIKQRIDVEILLAIEFSRVYIGQPCNLKHRNGCYLPESMMGKYGRRI